MSSQQTSDHIYCCLPADNDTGLHVFLFLPPVFVSYLIILIILKENLYLV